MVGNCEVTWAGPGWNKNDDGCVIMMMVLIVMIVMMTVMTVFLSYSWVCTLFGENDYDHCDGDDLYNDHHGEFEQGGQGRGSNGQRHQVEQKPSYSSLSCLIRT